MKKLLIMTLLMASSAFMAVSDSRAGNSFNMNIKTVDENGQAFKVETVRWWHVGKVDTIHQLECKTGPCSEWVLNEEISGSIVIHAATSIVKKDDAHCWDIYAGDLAINMPTREATVIITHSNMVCKSKKALQRSHP